MTEFILVKLIQPNSWNPNVMQEEEYAALKQDMHIHGVNGVDPVLVSPYACFYVGEPVNEFYVIVDGEHRWRAAQELGWKEILCEVREVTEDDAKALCYRRNRERGTIDPMKEALLFKSELDHQRSQKTIAGKYGVDQSTVSHRLSLLKLDSEVVETVKELPRGIMTPSHLEPISTLEPKDQKAIMTEVKRAVKQGSRPSVKELEAHVQRIKEERAEKEALEKALQKAKFPKCPKCRQPPKKIGYRKLPWVQCGRYHDWNLETGKGLFEEEHVSQNRLDGKSEPIKPKTIRCAHTVEELSSVFEERMKEIVPQVLKVHSFEIHGKLDGQDFGVELKNYGKSMAISIHRGQLYRGFRAEEHEYKSGEKSSVDAGSPDHVEEVKELIENAFQGKLGVESKRLKRSKTAEEVVHKLHSEPLEADNIKTTNKHEESLSAEDEKLEEVAS